MSQCPGIVVSVQGEQDYLRKAMAAGAKEDLVKPFEGDELLECIRHIFVREQKWRKRFTQQAASSEPTLGKVITIFSIKGGIGKTTIAKSWSRLGF